MTMVRLVAERRGRTVDEPRKHGAVEIGMATHHDPNRGYYCVAVYPSVNITDSRIAFSVKCDESNNPPEKVKQGIVSCEVTLGRNEEDEKA